MNSRILQIIKSKNLTSAKFADEIGVQRSSISHVLSGRNKPSLEFIQKILKKYPDIDNSWLLSGKGNILAKSEINENMIDFPDDTATVHSEDISKYQKAQNKPESPEKPLLKEIIDNKSGNDKYKNKKIEKIIVLYKDNSFKEYYPE